MIRQEWRAERAELVGVLALAEGFKVGVRWGPQRGDRKPCVRRCSLDSIDSPPHG